MTIRDILKNKPSAIVSSIGPDKTVAEAIHHMCEHNVGALLVRDDSGQPVGIITERDVLQAADRDTAGFSRRAVSEVMIKDVICGLPDDNASYAMHVMTTNRVRHLPVVEDNRIVGLISIGDVIKSQLEETQFQNRKLQDYLHLKGEL